MIKAVFFDCDGVLIDSERVHQRYNVQFARENGLTLEPEDFYPFIGVTTRSDIWNGIYAKAGSPWSRKSSPDASGPSRPNGSRVSTSAPSSFRTSPPCWRS